FRLQQYTNPSRAKRDPLAIQGAAHPHVPTAITNAAPNTHYVVPSGASAMARGQIVRTASSRIAVSAPIRAYQATPTPQPGSLAPSTVTLTPAPQASATVLPSPGIHGTAYF